MKKFLFLILACLSVLAAKAGDGSSRTEAIAYDWNNPVEVTAGTTWYQIDMLTLDTMTYPVVDLNITNPSTSSVFFEATIYVYEGQKQIMEDYHNYDLAPGASVQVRTSLLSMLRGMGYQVYVKLTSAVDLSFEAEIEESTAAEVGECEKYENLPFSDGMGIYIEGGKLARLKVGIDTARQYQKDIVVTVANMSAQANTLQASVAFECPAVGATSLSRTIGAAAEIEKTISYSSFAALQSDTVYILLNPSGDCVILLDYADHVVADPVCVKSEAVPFNYEVMNEHAAGEAWYAVALDTLRHTTDLCTVHVRNNGSATASLSGMLTFDCDGAAQNGSFTLAAGQTYSRLLSRDLVDALRADIDTAYIQVVSSEDLSIWVTINPPSAGSLCAYPINFDWIGMNEQGAESLWYKVDVAQAKAEQKDIVLNFRNTADVANDVTAEIAFDCSGVTTSYSRTLGAGATIQKTLTASFLQAVSGDFVLVRLTTSAAARLWASREETQKVISDCSEDKVVPYVWNSTVTVLPDTTWFKVSLDQLRAIDTIPSVTVTNGSAQTAHVEAALSFICPDTIEMITATRVLAPGQTISREIERALVEGYANQYDFAYVRVVSDQQLSFIAAIPVVCPEAKDSLIAATICPGDSVEMNGHYYYAAGIYKDTLRTIYYCDSIRFTLTLSHHPVHHRTIDTLACKLFEFKGVTYTRDTVFNDSLQNQYGCDSIITYRVTMKKYDFPSRLTLPTLFCGRTVDMTATMEDIERSDEEYLSQEWTVDGDPFTGDFLPAFDHETYTLTCKVTTECAEATKDFVLTVQTPTADYFDDLIVPANARYGNSLLLLNKNALDAMAAEHNASYLDQDVKWYKVIGEPDYVDDVVADAGDDEYLHTGFYYTLPGAPVLEGSFYAVIRLTSEEDCDAILRSSMLVCQPAQMPIRIAPTVVSGGEPITVYNLRPEQAYTLRSYTVDGQLSSQYQVSGETTFTFRAEGSVGYYVLSVAGQDGDTFKYIIK